MAVKVFSFAKSTNTSTPASQSVTGIGFKPRALILWTTGVTAADTWTDNYLFGLGYAARNSSETLTVGCVAAASQTGQASSNASRYGVAKALAIVEWGESVLAECDLSSMDNDGFTLSWTTNNATAYIIQGLALGGDDITDASVVAWTTGEGTGDKVITGAGFQPDCVLHATPRGSGAQASAVVDFGAMTSSMQFSMGFRTRDAQATMDTVRTANSSRCINTSNISNSTISIIGTYVSMDVDGFTVNLSSNPVDTPVYSLCLKGGNYSVGTFTKTGTAATVSQSVTGIGFAPGGLFTIAAARASGTTGLVELYFGVGATDGTSELAGCILDDDGAADSLTKCYATGSKVVSYSTDHTPAITVDADLESMDADGFTLSWTTNDGSSNNLIGYVAFLTAATGGSALLMQQYHHAELRGLL